MSLWDWKAPFYYTIRSLPFLRRILQREIDNCQELMQQIPCKPESVLDLGVGSGASLFIYAKDIYVIGLDHSLSMLQQAKRRGLSCAVQGEALHLPFPKHSFAIITAIGLTEYVSDLNVFLIEVQRVLSNQGCFLVTISPPCFWNQLRRLLGLPLYLISNKIWQTFFQEAGFILLDVRSSFLQNQYLLQKQYGNNP